MATNLPSALQHLSEKQLMIYNAEIAGKRKSTLAAYLLWFFFGLLGIHKFYLDNAGMGIAYICLLICTLCTPLMPLCAVASAPLAIMLFIDVFSIPSQVKSSEQKAGLEIANRLGSTSPIVE